MASRTRRRPPVVWLPNTDVVSISAGKIFTIFEHNFTPGAPLGTDITNAVPVVIDNPPDPAQITTTLADVEDSGYRLRRIVGRVWVALQQQTGGASSVIVTVGFIILGVDSGGVFTRPTAQLVPGDIINAADPWIWRRSWLLANPNGTAVGGTSIFGDVAPLGNIGVLSNSEGCIVDQKTARIVGPEQRLFMVASSTILENDDQDNGSTDLAFSTDLRVLASMRTTVGNRRNAAR